MTKYVSIMHSWHYRLHQITGAMATHWFKATSELKLSWAKELRAIAKEMEDDA